MQPGAQTQTVTVTEAVPLINTTNEVLSSTVESDQLAELPINGRLYTKVLDFQPGIHGNPGGNSPNYQTNGASGQGNYYYARRSGEQQHIRQLRTSHRRGHQHRRTDDPAPGCRSGSQRDDQSPCGIWVVPGRRGQCRSEIGDEYPPWHCVRYSLRNNSLDAYDPYLNGRRHAKAEQIISSSSADPWAGRSRRISCSTSAPSTECATRLEPLATRNRADRQWRGSGFSQQQRTACDPGHD